MSEINQDFNLKQIISAQMVANLIFEGLKSILLSMMAECAFMKWHAHRARTF